METVAQNFSNLFGVSIGVHLAYGLLKELHAAPLLHVERQIALYKQTLERLKEEHSFGLRQSLQLIELSKALHIIPLEKIVDRCAKISIAFAIYSLICLIFVSFFPQFSFSLPSIIVVLSFAILPMPVLALIVFLVTRRGLSELRKPLQIAMTEFSEVIGDSRKFKS